MMRKILLLLVLFSVECSCVPKKSNLALSDYILDLGTLEKDEIYPAFSIIRNTGNDVLIIERLDVGCGCTQAFVSKNRIEPNDTCRLDFTYNTKNKYGPQNEFICIQANTDSLVHVLQIKALVQ